MNLTSAFVPSHFSYTMAFFIPSSLQKRILRYALSRLELLDTKDHNLDDLDIVWGKESSVELRNVGVHLKKLSALLQLPRRYKLVKARILLLRITVPADLYKSGISIGIDGVKLDLELSSVEDDQGERAKSPSGGFYRSESQKSASAGRSRSSQSYVHDPGGLEQPDVNGKRSENLPSTMDLAKSFLQTEPEERAELQNSIAQSQYLAQSKALSEDDEATRTLGVGGGISLPGFVADFMKGVGDRVELSIKNADISLAMEVDLASGNSVPNLTAKAEPVTLQLSVQEVIIHGVTTDLSEAHPRRSEDETEMNESMGGVASTKDLRRIYLENVCGILISSTSLFSNLSRVSVPPSPSLTHSSANKKVRKVSPTLHSPSDYPIPVAAQKMDRSALSICESENGVESPSPRLATSLEELRNSAIFQTSGLESSSTNPELNLDQRQTYHDAIARSLSSNKRNDQLDSQQHLSSTSIPGSFIDYGLPSLYRDSLHGVEQSSRSQREQTEKTHSMELLRAPDETLHNGQVSPQLESMAQSKLFSHEEAESMYMSAMSQAPSQSAYSETAIPGDWEDSDSEDYQPRAAPNVHERAVSDSEQRGGQSTFSEPGQETDSFHEPAGAALIQPSEHVLNERATERPPMAQSLQAHPTESDKDLNPAYRQGSSTTSQVGLDDELLVVKNIFTIDRIAFEVPKSSGGEGVDLTYQEKITEDYRSVRPQDGPPRAKGQTSSLGYEESTSKPATLEPRPSTSIEVGHVDVHGDINLTKLTILVIQQLTEVFASEPVKHKSSTKKNSKASNAAINVKSVSWKFLDVVRGIHVSGFDMLDPSLLKTGVSEDSETLLKASIMELKMTINSAGESSTSTLSVTKIDFGYASESILSFDSGLKLRDSNRDILAPVNQDFILKITQSPDRRHLELTTLPLHVRFDLRRLDETFSWFGGFSSVLGLGNSMISTVTVIDRETKKPRPAKSARGVHFETGRQQYKSTEPRNPRQDKVTIRVGGMVFEIEGPSSSFRCESTAIKAVSRAEGVGLAVDRFSITGPYVNSRPENPSISARFAGVRIEYLPTPKDGDLARLLALLSPSKDKYSEEDDDILLETLFRQRRQGGVLRVTAEDVDGQIHDIGDLYHLSVLGEEMKKLSTVTKYLPEDDRPGIMTLLLIRQVQVQSTINETLGPLSMFLKQVEVAYITLPSLFALGVGKLNIERNASEKLLGEAVATPTGQEPSPTIMVRFIGNEMEPKVKVKLHNFQIEYRASTLEAIMGLPEALVDVGRANVISSTAIMEDKPPTPKSPPTLSPQSVDISDKTLARLMSFKIDIALHDVTIGLNPRDCPARGLLVLTDSRILCAITKDDEGSALFEINKASLMAIDDHESENAVKYEAESLSSTAQPSQLQQLSGMGYVSLCNISAMKTTLGVSKQKSVPGEIIEIDLRDMLLVIESCADSTQTLQTILNGLQPPQPPSKESKYRTEVVPVEDMLGSFSGNAFATQEGGDYEVPLELEEGDMVDDDVPQNLEFVSSFYNPHPETLDESVADSMLEENLESLASPPVTRNIGDKRLLESFQEQYQVAPGESTLNFDENHFGSSSKIGGTAHRWDIKKDTYELPNESRLQASPLKVQVRNVHVIWNLFDGYDWQRTRDTIHQAVAAVQDKAMEKRSRKDRRRSANTEEEDSVIADFLFNSIYIGIPANHDPRELSRQISRNIDDLTSETESSATSRPSDSPSRQDRALRPKSKARLRRSKYHKMTFELKGLSADMVVFPPESGETKSSIDIRVLDLEIFDHIPTSTWKKFATYMHDAGERESGTSMIHLEILNVKPVPTLAASEIILKVTYLQALRSF